MQLNNLGLLPSLFIVAIIVGLAVGVYFIYRDIKRYAGRIPGGRSRAFLKSTWHYTSLPTSFQGLLTWLGTLFLFIILAKLIGWFVLIIAIAVFMGWRNGFFTKRKSRP